MRHIPGSISYMRSTFNSRSYSIASIIVVGIGSFLLGGLTAYTMCHQPTDTPVTLEPLLEGTEFDDRQVYASKNGKRYYPWWCDKGRSIAEKNIVWFVTPEEAELKGYTISKSCQ